jgi:hypothetical protein
MWLLNARTRQLERFEDEREIYGRYAVLSHVWEAEEVTFQDVQKQAAVQKNGYAKIESTCRQALSDGLNYCWVDTCCIDKTSSAELSEAINSMYRWYYEAKVCYTYLSDVPSVSFETSKWFTRGWTLQELIAPGDIVFYDSRWEQIGSKISKLSEIAQVTRIDLGVLRDRSTLLSTSVAARMAWAADRVTTRLEDRAYSLMGLFDVNMPMIYGEGQKAFARLQEEIIKAYEDTSILAWQAWEECQTSMLLSPSPYGFRNAHDLLSWAHDGIDDSFALHNKGLRIELPVINSGRDSITAVLNCRASRSSTTQIALLLRKHPPGMTVPRREMKSTVCEMAPARNEQGTYTSLLNLDRRKLSSAQWTELLILKSPLTQDYGASVADWKQKIRIRNSTRLLCLIGVYPPEAYDEEDSSLTLVLTGSHEDDRGYMIFQSRSNQRSKRVNFGLFFEMERHTGPCLGLAKLEANTTEPAAILASKSTENLQRSARIEFTKGVDELVAKVERSLTHEGEVDWTISLSLEHYSISFRDRFLSRR